MTLARRGLAIVLLLGAAACSTSGRRAPAPPPPPEAVLRATLDNGLRVVIVPDPLAPVATSVVNYLVGANETAPGFPGTAHALEHMMFRGSPGLSAAQLATLTARMGGMFDADTQQTVTQYFFTVPAADLPLALRVEAVRMQGLDASPASWAKERGAIEQEVAQDLSSPSYVAYTKLLSSLFHGTPYARDALGTRPSFDATSASRLQHFHRTWYVPNNAVLVIAGDVRPRETLEEVRRLFGPIPSRPLPARPPVRLQPVRPRTIHLATDQPAGSLWIAFRTPGYGSPDLAAAEVLGDVLSSERGALYALVAEGKALGASFDLTPLPGTGLGAATVSFPRGADVPRLIAEVKHVLADAAAHGVPADLVEAAQRQAVADAEFQKNSVDGLAMLWSDALAVAGFESPADEIDAIRKVTPPDVDRVARATFDLRRAVVAVLTPRASGRPVAARGFGGRESFAPGRVEAVALPDWAQPVLEPPAVPRSTVTPATTTLPNGIRLIVQSVHVSPTVSVYGHIEIRPELEEPPHQEGVHGVLERLFSWGTTSLDRVAFQKALDDIAAREEAGGDFSLQVLRDHFDRGVALLAQNELEPALPAGSFSVVRRQIADALVGELESPAHLTHRALRTALFPAGDPSLREATPATVRALTLDDVRRYEHAAFRPDLTTIVVIGDVTPEEARRVIERYFGAWKAVGPKPETLLPPVPANRPGTTVVPDASRVQDEVILAETLGLTRSNPDYYALELGNHVLGGAFYATRLYRDLREEQGLVYYVGSSFDVGRTRSVYHVVYACDPPNVSRARAIVVRELESLRTEPVSEEELRQAQALLLRQIPLHEASVGEIADGLLFRASHALPLDEPIRAAHAYLKLGAPDVQAAFARWLRPKDLVQVTQGPPPR
jgi:zinc protease